MTVIQPRRTLSQPDLIALLNWELAAYEECDGCHVTNVQRSPAALKTECNWCGAVIDDPGPADARKHTIIEQVLAETREQFDVGLPS
ncbi:MAG TPA: hypothetical protein VFR66_05735 [Burkholderiales bacterium]|nr:hypothetical protein [Burkholderiales bacterium]